MAHLHLVAYQCHIQKGTEIDRQSKTPPIYKTLYFQVLTAVVIKK